jgi:BON domain
MDFSDREGILTVEGEVEHAAAKKMALELAAAVPGVSGIVDRLHVVPAQPMDDGTVRNHVCDAFIQEPVLQTCSIQVQNRHQTETIRESLGEPVSLIEVAVEDGVVTLNGQVPSLSHKRLVGVLAWWVPGSRDVINGLEVMPPQEDNDDEITDAVRLVLEKDSLVNRQGANSSLHSVNRPPKRCSPLVRIQFPLFYGPSLSSGVSGVVFAVLERQS